MSIKITPERFAVIEAAGFGISGDIGGLRKTTYYTPDGRIIKAIPNIREFTIRDKDGNVIGSETRDANLDKGWLSQMPQIKKLFCPTCDQWHDTLAQVRKCKAIQDRKLAKFEAQVNKEGLKAQQDKDIQLSVLANQVAHLTELVKQLTNVKITSSASVSNLSPLEKQLLSQEENQFNKEVAIGALDSSVIPLRKLVNSLEKEKTTRDGD